MGESEGEGRKEMMGMSVGSIWLGRGFKMRGERYKCVRGGREGEVSI